jgi:hypothetical protein
MEDFRSNVTNMNILVIEYNTFVQGVPHHLLDIVLPTEGMQLFWGQKEVMHYALLQIEYK